MVAAARPYRRRGDDTSFVTSIGFRYGLAVTPRRIS